MLLEVIAFVCKKEREEEIAIIKKIENHKKKIKKIFFSML